MKTFTAIFAAAALMAMVSIPANAGGVNVAGVHTRGGNGLGMGMGGARGQAFDPYLQPQIRLRSIARFPNPNGSPGFLPVGNEGTGTIRDQPIGHRAVAGVHRASFAVS
jgi:hypothetical protein